MGLVMLNRGQMMRTTPQLAPLSKLPRGVDVVHHTSENTYPPTSDLTCNRPNTRRIFSEIRFEPGTHRPRSLTLSLDHRVQTHNEAMGDQLSCTMIYMIKNIWISDQKCVNIHKQTDAEPRFVQPFVMNSINNH
ncbi:hypothetical protein AVEN_193104-1 [Araneus ventricosus]|uniref:Uncharacterized protein n=1 Tax=Araneus ventricosus TaxID=182803 RepID=A0A4Y2B1C1_ARAVE|nr:hypothetical protein AVEN_193104-1 [Araneus ventricosus]